MYLNLPLVVLVLIAQKVSSDCGCNKANRKTPKPSDDNNIDSNQNHIPSSTAFEPTDMVLIQSGTFEMGSDKPLFVTDFEGPIKNVSVEKAFYLDKYEVSNKKFSEFVEKTGYKTEAELFGDSFMFEMFITEEDRGKYEDVRAVQAPWWVKMKGVSWKSPEGPGSTIDGRLNMYNLLY